MGSQQPGVILLSEAAGGVMRHVIDLYRGLTAREWRVRMVLSPLRIEERYQEELRLLDQADIEYVPMRRAPHPSDLTAYRRISKILEQAGPQTILHAHSTKAGMLGSLLHSRVQASIFTPHAYRGVDPNSSRLARAFLQTVEHAYSKNYDRILAVAPAELEYARAIGLDETTLRCIPNGLDTRHVQFPRVLERRRNKSAVPLCLGFVGRLVYQKNPLLFLEVLAEVVRRGHDARALIVGDGPMKAEMLQAAREWKIADRIDWRGSIRASEVIHEMDVLVHTSVYEALPYVLIEACADLLPIVATSNYGSEAVLRSRLPRNIASAPDANEMAGIVLSLANDEGRRLKQAGIMAEIAREYSTDTMIDKIEAEYCSVVGLPVRETVPLLSQAL